MEEEKETEEDVKEEEEEPEEEGFKGSKIHWNITTLGVFTGPCM